MSIASPRSTEAPAAARRSPPAAARRARPITRDGPASASRKQRADRRRPPEPAVRARGGREMRRCRQSADSTSRMRPAPCLASSAATGSTASARGRLQPASQRPLLRGRPPVRAACQRPHCGGGAGSVASARGTEPHRVPVYELFGRARRRALRGGGNTGGKLIRLGEIMRARVAVRPPMTERRESLGRRGCGSAPASLTLPPPGAHCVSARHRNPQSTSKSDPTKPGSPMPYRPDESSRGSWSKPMAMSERTVETLIVSVE